MSSFIPELDQCDPELDNLIDPRRGIDEEEEDEFFDCNEQWDESSSLAKWSSMELETIDTDHANPNQVEPPVSFRRVQSLHERSSTTPIDLDPQPLSARPNFMSR